MNVHRFLFIFLFLILFILMAYVYLNNQHSLKIGGSDTESIVWHNNKIFSTKEIIQAAEFIEKNMKRFEPLRKNEARQLTEYSKKHKFPFGGLISFRNIIATQHSMDAKNKSNKYYRDIISSSSSSLHATTDRKQIPKLFEKYPLPPLEIIRILKDHGSQIPEAVQHYASENDADSPIVNRKIMKDADEFENNLVKWVRKTYPHMKFKTQNQLVEEQTTKFGQPFATPDILFDEPVSIKVINPDNSEYTQLVRWIDAKNYTFVKIPFMMKHIEKQALKYVQNYGPGALAFHYGITRGLRVPDTLILDASFID